MSVSVRARKDVLRLPCPRRALVVRVYLQGYVTDRSINPPAVSWSIGGMWGDVVSVVRQGLRWRRRRGRRTTARVVDESALDAVVAAEDGGAAPGATVAPSVAGALARALLALACAVRFDGDGVSTEEAWAASAWRPRADEVSHLMVRESMRYAIYA